MFDRQVMGAIALIVMLAATMGGVSAHDEARYPAWTGQWIRNVGAQWDPSKPRGPGQQAPLTPASSTLP